MNKPLLLLFLGLLILPSAFAACPGGSNQLIFKISGTTNAHAELYSGTSYTTEICYDTIFGTPYGGALPHAGNTVLKASAATNAHVEQSTLANYSTNIQYGDLVCTYKLNCTGNEVCVATISGATNAHVATCTDPPAYATKVCCSSAAAVPVCSVASVVSPIVLNGSSAVTVSYSGFVPAGAGHVFACGDSASAGVVSCAAGTCSFSCGSYSPVGTYSVTARLANSAGGSVVCSGSGSGSVVVNQPAGSGPYLRLTKIEVAPENFNVDPKPDFTKLDVSVKNFGDTTNALIDIKVFGATDFSMASTTEFASAQASCVSLAKNIECTKRLDGIDVLALPPGSYKLVIKALDGTGKENDSKSVFFVVIGSVPVPELGLVFIPLLAISALAIMFFAGKSRKPRH